VKILRNLVIPAAAAAALILPAGVLAQQATAPNQNPPAAGQWQGHGGHRGGFMRMFRNLNLSAQQKSKIQQIVQQYHQAHPQGSQPNPQARKQMRGQIMNLLTPQQRTQLQQQMQQMRAQRGQHPDNDEPQAGSTPQP